MKTIANTGLSATARSALSPRRGNHEAFARFGPAAATAVLIVVFAALNPGEFLSIANVSAILDQAAVPLIVVTGLTFVVVMGSVDLSVEGVMAASGLTFVLLAANSSDSVGQGLIALVVALVIGLCFGAANGLIHTRLRVPSFILTLGTWYIGIGVASVLYGDAATTLGTSSLVGWLGGKTLGLSTAFWIAVFAVVLGLVLTRWTALGRYAYAIGDDEQTAAMAGIPVQRFKIYVFIFAGLCSALAGVIGVVRLGAGVVEVGSGQLFFTLTAVVVGGTALAGGQGGVGRSIVGVLLLTVINNGLVLSGVNPSIQQALFGIVIIIAVVATAIRQRTITRVVK
jgi:ribose transport system permease protein